MKKIAIVLAALLLCFGATACGGSGPSTNTAATTTAATTAAAPKDKIVVVGHAAFSVPHDYTKTSSSETKKIKKADNYTSAKDFKVYENYAAEILVAYEKGYSKSDLTRFVRNINAFKSSKLKHSTIKGAPAITATHKYTDGSIASAVYFFKGGSIYFVYCGGDASADPPGVIANLTKTITFNK